MAHSAEKEQVIQAIGDLGRRVTVADVATKTGLPVLTVSQLINQVAAETGGHMEVATTGDIAYKFNPGFSNAYLATGIKRAFQIFFQKTGQVLFYLLKISFGIMLIISLFIVIVTILALILSRGGDRDDDRGGLDFNFFDYLILRDIFFWGTYYATPPIYDYSTPTVRRRGRSNFLLNCFSFLFGDGDPNEGLEEKKWQLIANVIKQHKNVVTAEQLAPYLGSNPKDEDAVLPALVRFNGKPEVTESGNIIYTFPELTATAARGDHLQVPPFLREFPWQFTNVDQGALMPVYIIAGLNFFGSWFLWSVFSDSGQGVVPFLFTALVTYGTLFVVIPIVRAIIQAMVNNRIQERNERRAAYAQALRTPTDELSRKLAEMRNYGLREKQISKRDIVYTTEKDALDQEDDLDRKFKQLEGKPQAKTKPQAEDEPGEVIKIRRKVEDTFDASP